MLRKFFVMKHKENEECSIGIGTD
ncbi:Protein of unknown function [Bacillus cytotoxicus]|uniref:Uncharacterized protein n=1 Tax=Bacillus cytotoxicus TaxID=580165 RepID=A0AAX2CHW6_9BACI|nr:Protein of unknown function [Bacillus cytotoxicus]SCN38038.1 Protein of unknown function [Bacillus cytotoxicus]